MFDLIVHESHGNEMAEVRLNVGVSIHGNHIESNNPDMSIPDATQGFSVTGNLFIQNSNVSSTCIICGTSTGLDKGVSISGNEFDIQGSSTFNLTSAISLPCDGCTIRSNIVDAFLTTNETLTNYTTLQSGSVNSSVAQYALGPNAQVSGKTLTITNSVDDAANNACTADIGILNKKISGN